MTKPLTPASPFAHSGQKIATEPDWMLVLAPPGDPDDPAAQPDCARLAAFRFSGAQAVILHRGTWHAGQLFEAPEVDFINLELADTNEANHVTAALDQPRVLAGPWLAGPGS